MHELTLENGARVRVRPVPPHVEALFNAGVRESIPQEPKPPTTAVTMADGHVELDVVTSGPEFDAYQAALVAWEDARNDVVVEAYVGYDVLRRDYAVVEWLDYPRSGEPEPVWRRGIPDKWLFPDALRRAGVKTCGNRRVDFIGIELLTTAADVAAVEQVATGEMATITDQEAARVRASFRTGRGRKRDGATARPGWIRRVARALSRRDGSSESVGVDA